MKKNILLLVGAFTFSSLLACGVYANETTQVASTASTPIEVNMEELRVDLLEQALAPDSAKDAINKWAEAVFTRNGAYQYAIFSESLKEKTAPYFKKHGWVTGVSSPWVEEYHLKNKKKISDTEFSYNVEFILATSTGNAGTEKVTVTIKKEEDYWFIDQVDAEKSALVIERTPYHEQLYFTYRAKDYAFSIPQSWDKKYTVEEKDERLHFFYKPENTHIQKELLFTIEKIKEKTWDSGYEDSLYIQLGKKKDYVYAMLPVSENQYASKPNSLEYKEFEEMCMEFGIIKGSFQFIE